MKQLFFLLLSLSPFFAKAQGISYMYDFNQQELGIGSVNVQFSNDPSFVFYRALDVHDTVKTSFNTDTVDFLRVATIQLPGSSNEYLRGDGVISMFPIKTGKDTLSGVSAMTSYVVAHNYGYVPVITLTPRSADAAAVSYYISDVDSTTFTITFTNQPPVGEDNMIFDRVAIKP